jgi:hypothetical protein
MLGAITCFVIALLCGGLVTFGDGVADGFDQSTQQQGEPTPTSDDPSTSYEDYGEPTPNVELPPPDTTPDDDGNENTCSPAD